MLPHRAVGMSEFQPRSKPVKRGVEVMPDFATNIACLILGIFVRPVRIEEVR